MSSTIAVVGPGRRRLPHAARLRRLALSAAILSALGILIVYPIGTLVYASLVDEPPRPGGPIGRPTVANFARIVAPANLEAIRNSVVIGLGGTALALAIGGTLAWLAVRTDLPARWLTHVGGLIPLFLSSFVGALAWSFLATPRIGYLNIVLHSLGIPVDVDVLNMPGIVFVTGIYHAPFAFLYLSGALALMNHDLEEAGRVHGGRTLSVVRHVTMPLVLPSLLAAGTITLVMTIENFPIVEILGTPRNIATVPVQIYRLMTQTPSLPNAASAFGTALLAFLVLLVAFQARVLRRRDYATVTGKGVPRRRVRLGIWRWPALLVVSIYVLVAVVLPLWALAMRALSRSGFFADAGALVDPHGMTLATFTETFRDPGFLSSLRNSVVVALATAIVGGAFHYCVAHVVQRSSLPGRRLMEQIAVAPIAMPGIVIGLGYLWGWIRLPIPLFGSLAIFAVAYTARLMPFGYRAMTGTISQVHRELEEAAAVAGAGKARAAATVTVPLVRPGIVAMVVLLVIMSFHELSVSLWLQTGSTQVLSVFLFQQWSIGSTGELAAASLLMSVVLLVLTVAVHRVVNQTEW